MALLEQVNHTRAELFVVSAEIEAQLLRASTELIELEHSALASAFEMSNTQLHAHVHPYQRFASTCYPTVDKLAHLDITTKVAPMQKFLTKLRNRCTEVETLTSGPGYVFTVRDFNDCVQMLCRSLIKYSEVELKGRSETFALKEQHLLNLVYVKD